MGAAVEGRAAFTRATGSHLCHRWGRSVVVCEWPAVEIPVTRQEIDAQMILDAAEKARAMFGDGHHVLRDGRAWRLGTGADAAWINDGTSPGQTITYAIPPVFDSYCTWNCRERTTQRSWTGTSRR